MSKKNKNVLHIADLSTSGFSCATPLSVQFHDEGNALFKEPIIFAEEGAIIKGKTDETSPVLCKNEVLIEEKALQCCDIRFTFDQQSYFVEDRTKEFNPKKALALVLKDKTMREVILIKEGMIFCIGKLIVQISKVGLKHIKAIWDSRADDFMTESSSSNCIGSRSSVTSLSEPRQNRVRSLRFAPAIDTEEKSTTDNTALATPLKNPIIQKLGHSGERHSKQTSSILKKQGSLLKIKKKRKARFPNEDNDDNDNDDDNNSNTKHKSVGFRIAKNSPMQEGREHKEIVDEIIEASDIEITIIGGEKSLIGQTYKIQGDGVISFGSALNSTVVLPKQHYKKSESKIRMWGSQYYMFAGRDSDTFVYVGQNGDPFPVRPGDVYQYGLENENDNDDQQSLILKMTTVLAFESSPNKHILCSLKNPKIASSTSFTSKSSSTTSLTTSSTTSSTTDGFHFRLLASECSIGTRRDDSTIDVSVKDITMSSLHATMRKWKDTYYLDPESPCRHTYHCIGKAPYYCRGPCPLNVNDIFCIGKNEIIVRSILNVDKFQNDDASEHTTSKVSSDGSKLPNRNLDNLRKVNRRSSLIEATDNKSTNKQIHENGRIKHFQKEEEKEQPRLQRNISVEEVHQDKWSTRIATIPLTLSGTGTAGNSSSSMVGGSDESDETNNGNSSENNREKWFGYAGAPQSGDLFNAHSNSFHMLSGGAFQNSGNEWDPIPHHKIDFPRISLEVIKGPIRGSSFTISQGIATIGRHPQNSIVCPDRSVGAIHASISFRSGKFYLEDLNSPTGTFTRVQQDDGVALERGDMFLLGNTEMLVYSSDLNFGKVGSNAGCCSIC